MNTLYRTGAAALLGSFLIACAGDPASQCVGEQCVDACTTDSCGPDTTEDDIAVLDTSDVADIADIADLVDSSDTTDTNTLGAFGEPCTNDIDCLSGYCIDVNNGRACTELCTETCPADFECRLLANAGGDATRLCVPVRDVLCQPCDVDSDCWGFGALCLEQGNGTFCATACDSGVCPSGFTCNRVTIAGGADGGGDLLTTVCEPDAGECHACLLDAAAETNTCGGCTSLEGEPEAPCGVCGSGVWVCNMSGMSVSCEGDLGEAAQNACGGCGVLEAVPGASCGSCGAGTGVWVCDADDESVSCVGDIGAVENACGGCTTLDATPGAPCGTCGSGEYTCSESGDAVACVGASDEAANACGGCTAIDEVPGTPCGTCDSGTYTCADGGEAITCEGASESALNACGGCNELEATLGTACGECGTGEVVCDGENATRCTCDGATYSWEAGAWSACPPNTWQYTGTGACSVACGDGTAPVSYACPTETRTQTRSVVCRSSGGAIVSDTLCSGTPAPATTTSCSQSSCEGADPSGTEPCNPGACVTCQSQYISVPTGSYGGAVCTDLLPDYTGVEGAVVWANRPWGNRCRGSGCLITSGCGDTPYLGTVEGGVAGTCENYCAVRATCTRSGWVDHGYTW